MGRSFARAASVPALPDFYHAASDRHYAVIERGGKYLLRRWQNGGTNVVEKSVDYVIGSGNHSRTYVHVGQPFQAAAGLRPGAGGLGGHLIELPVSWYAEGGGTWAMSPGYDRPDHLDFRRPITDDCLFCHNGYPRAGGSLAASSGTASRFQTLESVAVPGIDCERCHGPGDDHARTADPRKIVNPRKLPADRRMEVCLQCHLETTSRPLPNAIRRYNRAPFSYNLGEPLGDFVIHFDSVGREDKFEVNHAGYRLRQSKCFVASSGSMTCITCHNPHRPAARENYDQACRGCHAAAHEAGRSGCAGCHMPKRRTEDAVHVVMTEHRIARRPPARDLLAPLDETKLARAAAYSGPVRVYYPAGLRDPLYEAVAQVRDGANPKAGIAALEKLLDRSRPAEAEFYFELAEALRKSGQSGRAVRYYEEALRHKPALPRARAVLGQTLLSAGDGKRALTVLEAGPANAEVLNTLGVACGQAGRLSDSLRTLARAVELNPDYPLAWLNLGVSREQSGDFAGAEAAYREAIRIQPELNAAREHLRLLKKSAR